MDHDYFSLSTKTESLRYFLRQGNVTAHSLDRVKWHLAPRLSLTLDFPSHVDIEASSRCQMACPMCGRHLMKDLPQGHMDFLLFRRIIDECATEGVYSVKLSWRGEPLLNPQIVDMVAYAKHRGIPDVAFLTNGERLDRDLAAALVEAGLDWLSISADGLGETYESIRRPAKFEDTVEKVRLVRLERERRGRAKPLIRIQSIASAINGNAPEFYEFWSPIADRVNFIADQARSSEERDFALDPHYVCQSPWQRICVMWDGRVAQCHSDYLQKNVLGDAGRQTLRQIWHGEHFAHLRRLMRRKRRLELAPCRVCCDGGVTTPATLEAGGRRIRALRYVGQEASGGKAKTGGVG